MNKNITCTVCPIGCRMTVEMSESGEIMSVKGNTCKRGEKYAYAEILNPVRTLTSTVKLNASAEEKLLPVKTDKPIPKGKLSEAMRRIKKLTVNLPVNVGDILIKDFMESGTNLVACKNIK